MSLPAAMGSGTRISAISAEPIEGGVSITLSSEGAFEPNFLVYTNPLRVVAEVPSDTVTEGVTPHLVGVSPVLQITQSDATSRRGTTDIEFLLMEHAEFWAVGNPSGTTVFFRRAPTTKQVAGSGSRSFITVEQASSLPITQEEAVQQRLTDGLITGTTVMQLAQEEGDPEADGFVVPEGFEGFDIVDQEEEEVAEEGSIFDQFVTDPQTEASTGRGSQFGSLQATDPYADSDVMGTGQDWGTYIQSGETQLGAEGQRYTGAPITLNLQGANLLDVLRQIADITGFNIVIDPGVQGVVTLRLEEVPWDQALDIILRNNGLGRTFDGNVMRVATLEKLKQEEIERLELQRAIDEAAPLYTEVLYISYADAADLVTILSNNLSNRGIMTVDDRTNAILVTDIRSKVELIKRFVRILDRRTRQVSINTRIVTATKNFTRNLGLSYSLRYDGTAATGNNTRFNFPYNYSVATAVDLPGETVPQIASINLGDILDTTFLNLAINAAESDGTGKVIANPKIITSDNQNANITSGLQVPYILAQGDIEVPTGGGGAVEAGTTQFIQFQNVDVTLDVTPQITNDDYIDLEVSISNNSLGSGNPPSINVNSAQTKVLIKDGDTFVIGGFKQINIVDNEDRIPTVHKIPVLGWFFKAKSNTESLSDLLFFITPNILKDEGSSLVTAAPGANENNANTGGVE